MAAMREYTDSSGRSPFGRWFNSLGPPAANKVRVALARVEAGNLGSVRSVGDGVLEIRVHFGPGYRVYFGRDGATIIILLGGGDKRRQSEDIKAAKARWRSYQAE